MYNIGFTTVTFRQKSRLEICEIAHENNIKFIEWGADIHLPPNDEKALLEVISLQKRFNLTAISYGSYYRLGCEDYCLWENITKTALAIGAKIIRVWQGNISSDNITNEQLSSMVNETKKLADIAADKGLIIAFEFHKQTNNDNGKSCVSFLKSVDRPNVKTYWQPFSTSDDINNLKAVLPYLVCIHVFEWNKNEHRYSFKHGKKRWTDFLKIVNSSGFSPYLIIEFVKHDSEKQFKKDVDLIRKLICESNHEGA